jgi:hypothetical protein
MASSGSTAPSEQSSNAIWKKINNPKEVHMGLNKLVEAALIIVLIAAAAGQLPRLVQTVRVAQLQFIKDSQSSKWGRAMLLPSQQ